MEGRRRFVAQRGWVLAVAGLVLLGACSTPMPRAPSPPPTQLPPPRPAPAVEPAAPVPPPPPREVPPPPAPVTPPPLPPTPPVVSVPPVSPAVAARFPEPNVVVLDAGVRGRPQRLHDQRRAAHLPARADAQRRQRGARQHGRAAADRPVAARHDDRRADLHPTLRRSPPWPRPRDRPPRSGVARRSSSLPASTATSRPAPKRCIVAAQQLAEGRFDRVLEQIDVYLLPRANPDGAALGQRAAATASTSTATTCCCARPEAQAEAELMRGVAPLVVLDLHEYPVDAAAWSSRFGAVQRFDVAAAVRDHRQHAALHHQGGRGMVPRAARRRAWCGRLQQRLVPHDLDRPGRSQGLDGRRARRRSGATPTA